MRITDRYLSLVDRAGPARPAGKVDRTGDVGAGRARSFEKAPSGVLDVSVSEEAQELASGKLKLEDLKTSIKNGTYRIDPAVIARRMVGGDE